MRIIVLTAIAILVVFVLVPAAIKLGLWFGKTFFPAETQVDEITNDEP